LAALRPAIDRHFGHDDVAAIMDSLESESAPAWRDWAVRTREALGKRSPMMLAVTLEELRRGATLALEDCLRMELDLVRASIEHGDIIEGIRAQILDKDNKPRWKPARVADVSRASVQAFFAPREAPERHPLAHLADSRASPRVAARFTRAD
jgi:hypothetical protein